MAIYKSFSFIFLISFILVAAGLFVWQKIDNQRKISDSKARIAQLEAEISLLTVQINELRSERKEFAAAGEKAAGWLMQAANNKVEEARSILDNMSSAEPTNDAMKPVMKSMQDAISLAMVAAEVAPENAKVWHFRGDIYFELVGVGEGFDGWALKMYEKALELDPNYAPSWNDMGRVYLKTDNLVKAKEAFGKAIALDEDYIDPHYYLVLINEREGKDDDTVAGLEKLSAMIDASDTKAQEHIKEAILRVKGGKPLSGDFDSEK